MSTRPKRVHRVSEVDDVAAKGHHALEVMTRLAYDNHPEHNPMRQLKLYRQHAIALVNWVLLMQEVNQGLLSQLMLETPNSHLPWGQDEDVFLVDSRAAGAPIHEIANELGRTPAACATRLSQLTGIPRSQLVEAYLEGTLNTEPVHGFFQGRIVKESG